MCSSDLQGVATEKGRVPQVEALEQLRVARADGRWKITQPVRAVAATVLHPVQEALLSPFRWWDGMSHYLAGVDEARRTQAKAQQLLTAQSERVTRMGQLESCRPGKLDAKDFDNLDADPEDLGSEVNTVGNCFFLTEGKLSQAWGKMKDSLEAKSFKKEILGRGSRYKAFWWSPDSKRIAFMRFDDNLVPIFPI